MISANPTLYPSGLVEFYFETARTFMDLTLTQTLTNFTSLRWIVPHAGGAFPAIEDRFLTSQPADFQEKSREAFATRVFWDVAGPVFPKQIWGLLGYGVPVGQFLYGSVCFCTLSPGGRERNANAHDRISSTRRTSPTSMRLRRLKM